MPQHLFIDFISLFMFSFVSLLLLLSQWYFYIVFITREKNKMEEWFLGIQGLDINKRKLWVLNMRVAPHSSAIHTNKQIIVAKSGDQNTLMHTINYV